MLSLRKKKTTASGKTKRPKKITTGQAKKRAWDAFSRYIRLRDAIETTGTKTHVRCCTSGVILPAFGVGCAQAGHFIAGRGNGILLDERGCHAQSYVDNIYKKGNSAEYWLFMEKKYGRAVIDDLIRLSKTIVQIKAYEYLEKAEYYEKKYQELLRS